MVLDTAAGSVTEDDGALRMKANRHLRRDHEPEMAQKVIF